MAGYDAQAGMIMHLADSDCPNIEVVSAFEFDYNSTIEMLLNCT